MKELIRLVLAPMNSTEINAVSKLVSAAYNETLKAEKAKDAPKKKAKGLPQLAKDVRGDAAGYGYDEYDDEYDDGYDFM